MKLDVAKISSAKGAKMPVDVQIELKNISLSGETLRFAKPTRLTGTLANVDGKLELKGQLDAEVIRQCGRCLQDFQMTMEVPVEQSYIRAGEVEENDAFDEVAQIYTGNSIDLSPLVEEAIVLELPMLGLCRSDCQGLCEVCGGNRNEQACSCQNHKIDPRFEALKQLLEQK